MLSTCTDLSIGGGQKEMDTFNRGKTIPKSHLALCSSGTVHVVHVEHFFKVLHKSLSFIIKEVNCVKFEILCLFVF